MARWGYAVIAHVDTVDSGEAQTTDDPPTKAQFTFAKGRCLELLYVGRGYSLQDGDEAYLRLNAPEDDFRLAAVDRGLARGICRGIRGCKMGAKSGLVWVENGRCEG